MNVSRPVWSSDFETPVMMWSTSLKQVQARPISEVLTLADRDNRILLTHDKDFGELVIRQQHRIPALVLMRTGSEDYLQAWQRLEAAMARFGDELLGRYTVVEASRLRKPSIAGAR